MSATDFTPKIRWNESETHTFVKLYLSHNCLWDPEHVDYKQKYRRQDAYKQIIKDFQSATHMKLNEYDVRQKIKSLRSTYNMELIKIKQHDKKPTLPWFSDYHKCLQNITRTLKNERNSIQQEPTDNEETEKLWDTEDTGHITEDFDVDLSTSDTKDPINPEENYAYHSICIVKSEPETEEVSPENLKRHKSFKSKKKKLKRLSTSSNYSEQTFRGSMESNSSSREDEFDIYGKYVATQLREMGIQRALRVQLQIQSIVSEARLEAIKDMDL